MTVRPATLDAAGKNIERADALLLGRVTYQMTEQAS